MASVPSWFGAHRRLGWAAAAILCVAAAIPIYFACRTRLVWEDYFITYRFAENLARGHGLVYQPGAPAVYGFTSPLNTLLPALFAWVGQAKSYALPFELYRAVSYLALMSGVIAAALLSLGSSTRAWAIVCALAFPLLAVLEIKTTAFALSGQETGLLIGFFGLSFVLLCRGWNRHPCVGGALWAGLMYTRPDGCVYILVLAVLALAFERSDRRGVCQALLKSALVCALAYLPWFLFTWAYYGSPVPHTIVAKHGVKLYHSDSFGLMEPFFGALSAAPSLLFVGLGALYDPLVSAATSWPKWLHDTLSICELAGLLYWLIPSGDRLGRIASAAAFLVFCYLAYVFSIAAFAPWYLPVLAFLLLFALSRALATVPTVVALPLLAGLFFVVGYTFCCSLEPLRLKQDVIEWGLRRKIGLWLHDNVPSGQTVYLEPLGYIGYFSQDHMVDWPGLISPEVVAIRDRLGNEGTYSWGDVAEVLKPDWIVARPSEIKLMRELPYLSTHYVLAQAFDARPALRAAGTMRGISMLYPDDFFAVYRRRD